MECGVTSVINNTTLPSAEELGRCRAGGRPLSAPQSQGVCWRNWPTRAAAEARAARHDAALAWLCQAHSFVDASEGIQGLFYRGASDCERVAPSSDTKRRQRPRAMLVLYELCVTDALGAKSPSTRRTLIARAATRRLDAGFVAMQAVWTGSCRAAI